MVQFQHGAFIICVAAVAASLGMGGCSSDSKSNGSPDGGNTNDTDAGNSGGSCKAPGGADTSKPANTHCTGDAGMITQATGMCVIGSDEEADAGDEYADAGPLSSVLGGDYGDTNYGAKAFDDDCKYEVSWTSTPICDNANVTFTVTVNKLAGDGGGVSGAKPYLEVFKIDGSSVHFPTATKQAPTEKGNGVYEIGPVKFNAAGQWIVRVHLFEECSDSEDSPHGHAAFYVTVP